MKKFFGLLLLLILLLAAAAWWAIQPVQPPGETFVVIPSGTGTERIAQMLEDKGVIRSRYAFEAARLWRKGSLKAGEYRFADAAGVLTVYDRIARGDVYTLTLVVPEGYNIFDIAQAAQGAKLGTAKDWLAGARANTDLIADLSPHAASLEGYLYPDTYKFMPVATVRQMQAAMVARFRSATRALGVAPARLPSLVTMASLVEKETGQASDRPLVASVFQNRLRDNMPLATDPAVVYAALLEGRYRGTIYASDLKAESAYNTYLHTGLPPGPICNPGAASLQAALHPAQSDYLYFVAGANGQSHFARTLEEHNQNVAGYRKSQGPER